MHFSSAAVVGLTALSSYAAAQGGLAFTTVPNNCQVGQSCTIEWEGAGGAPVEIILRQGNPEDLNTVETIAPNASGGSFEWTPPSNLANGADYAFEIRQGGVNNFSEQIPITGGDPNAVPADDDDDNDDDDDDDVDLDIIVGSQGLVSETETDTVLVTETDTDTELVTDTATETETETETDLVSETETDTELVTETDTELVTETDTETLDIETETETETVATETETEIETETETETDAAETADPNAAPRLSLSVSLVVGAVAAVAYFL